MMRFLALALSLLFFTPIAVMAEDDVRTASTPPYADAKIIFLDEPSPWPYINPRRPSTNDLAKIERDTSVRNIQTNPSTHSLGNCIYTQAYDHRPVMDRVAQASRVIANNSEGSIASFSFQPYFSGLKGPNITFMRVDLERAMITHQGSSNEIYHNARFLAPRSGACDTAMRSEWDIELHHQIDGFDSDHAPLVRSDLIINDRLHFGGYFLGTLSARYLLYDNLQNEPDLQYLNTWEPTRQDYLGYAWQGVNLERMMLSAFATPFKNTYVAAHAGYLEEMFFGAGGEFLYRPYDSAVSIGGEAWGVLKRIPYYGNVLTLDNDNEKFSALLNLWYDVPQTALSFGLSTGQFLDGDAGYQIRGRYRPASGWRVEGYATYSNQQDERLDHDKPTHYIIGARVVMPLGAIKGIPDNSRQTIALEPIARDHGQRLNNPYPLYDLTDPWQANNLYKYWGRLTQDSP